MTNFWQQTDYTSGQNSLANFWHETDYFMTNFWQETDYFLTNLIIQIRNWLLFDQFLTEIWQIPCQNLDNSLTKQIFFQCTFLYHLLWYFFLSTFQRSYAERVRGEARKKWLQAIITAGEVSGIDMDPVYKAVFQALYKVLQSYLLQILWFENLLKTHIILGHTVFAMHSHATGRKVNSIVIDNRQINCHSFVRS